MICCRIITDYDKDGSFNELCKLLGKKGDWLWHRGSLYFADTEGDTTEKSVNRYIKKAGYTKSYVEVFDKDHEPRLDEDAKSWVADKLTKIMYLKFEQENQKMLQETSRGLKEIETELDGLIKDALANQPKSEETEDNQ